VLPASEATATPVFEGLDIGRAIAAMAAVTATPFEVTGAAHVLHGLGDGPATRLRVEGFAGSVVHRTRALAAARVRFGAPRVVENAGEWTYNLMQPAISGELKARKVATLEEKAPQVIAAGNIGCMMQIGSGTAVPVVHTAELLDWATGGPKPRALKALPVAAE
jgi:hypothetical protein